MQSKEVKMRFGRCPYCRAMIYQDLKAVIYYCSKCRTPIRGKNPEPTDDTEYSLSQLEILSFDTMSVFSDELEPSNAEFDPSSRETGPAAASASPYRAFNSARTGRRSSADLSGLDRNEETTGAGRSGSPLHNRVSELRPASRRTRRPLSADLDARRDEGSSSGSDSDVPRTRSASCYRRLASPLCSQELEASMVLSGHDQPAVGLARSPLTDPAFQQDLLQALENLRKLIVAVEEPYRVDGHQHAVTAPRTSASCNDSGTRTVTRRDSRLLRRLESKLSQALPADTPLQDATTSSSSSSASTGSRRGGERRGASRHHCRPILGGTPFVACDMCSEILQLPAALSVDKSARLQCGGCGEVLALTLPANAGSTDRPKKFFPASQPAVLGSDDAGEYVSVRSRLSGGQLRQGPDEGPLHRVLGYSSVSSVLRSRRYEEHS